MAPPSRTIATSSASRRRAQPSTARHGGPPYSQDFVNSHPELCYAPRLAHIPLPQVVQPVSNPSPHTSYPTAHAPSRAGRDAHGAPHLVPRPRAQAGGGPLPNASHVFYPPPYTPMNAVPAAAPPPYATALPPISANIVPVVQSSPVPVPKPRYPTSPPTPEPSPPRRAVASFRRKRTSADDAQHGAPMT